jgi:hypothetical protein
MSFAILGANAALVPNRVRIAKANNTRVVSTVTVAVRPTFPALDASPTSIRYRHASCARYLDRLVSVPLAPLETRGSTEDPVRFFSIRPKPTWRWRSFVLLISLSSRLGSHEETTQNPTIRLFREKARPA